MYWADELAASVTGRQVVNDSKSPSGTVHVGSLRGVVLHDAIHRALRAAGHESTFLYGVDDMDAMDSQALLTPDAVDRYMGAPLSRVPAPEGSSAANYARHFVGEIFFRTFEPLGIKPEFYWVSELYEQGRMDPYVDRALDRADRVRDIYLRVSHVERTSDWLPIQVICEACGKIGTTYATDWDGSTVAYKCLPDMVAWAKGCGHEGRVSPLGGRAKLPWNLEWAAKWGLLGVTIEGCGKDLATAGGSRDRSDAISREVFEVEPPRNVAYEFLNVGGKKMSTSRGQGAAAHTIAEVLPAAQLRFLFLRPRPSQVIEFDPEGDTIPRLFDEFDRIAAATAGHEVKGELPADHDRLFAYSLPGDSPDVAAEASAFRPAFGHLALLLQIPGVNIAERMEAEKGAPLKRTRDGGAGRRGRRLPAPGWSRTPPSGPGWPFAATPCRTKPPPWTRTRRATWRRWLRPRRRRSRAPGTPGRPSSSASPGSGSCHRAAPSPPCTRPSWAAPTVRAPAGCWPAWSRTSWSSGCEPQRAERRGREPRRGAPRRLGLDRRSRGGCRSAGSPGSDESAGWVSSGGTGRRPMSSAASSVAVDSVVATVIQ